VQDSNVALYSRQKSAEVKLYETRMMPTMWSFKTPQGLFGCQIQGNRAQQHVLPSCYPQLIVLLYVT
ncbi:hypothetical protein ACJX0J_016710, partial [Zea mays]